jgi:8-oxo-dGTP pyrophosphatase MutT (NUDIX family)
MPASRLRWQPDVTVAAVVLDRGRVLCVEEQVHGALVLNQPAGHLEPGETLVEAMVRETLEETGWQVEATHFIGAYQWRRPGLEDPRAGHYLRMAFCARPLAHDPGRALDEGIQRALWMTPAELRDAADRHRSPLVWQVVADALAGRRHPLSVVGAA